MNAPTSIGQLLRIDLGTRVTLGGDRCDDLLSARRKKTGIRGGPPCPLTVSPVLLAQTPAAPPASGARLIIAAALVGIALIVVLITWLKVHPFLA